MKTTLTLTLLLLLGTHAFPKEQLFPVLTQDVVEGPANRVVYNHLAEQAFEALDRREERLSKIKTPEDFKAYQEKMKNFFLASIGGFPERTPLKAQVVGDLDGGDHRIEKVIYESRPSHRVTATLYLPKAKPPYYLKQDLIEDYFHLDRLLRRS